MSIVHAIPSISKSWAQDGGCYATALLVSPLLTCDLCLAVPPKLGPFVSDRTLHLGERATLTCSVIKGDLPLTISWLKDGKPVDPKHRLSINQVDQFNSILLIESLSPEHNGNYSCQARNPAAGVFQTQRLVVNGNAPKYPPFSSFAIFNLFTFFQFLPLSNPFRSPGMDSPREPARAWCVASVGVILPCRSTGSRTAPGCLPTCR